jgi:hypothetical protein
MVKFWQFFKKDLNISPDAIAGNIETTGTAVLGLAEKLQDKGKDIQQLASLVTKIDSLLDILNSPLTQVAGATLPFLPIATGMLRFCLQAAKHKPTLAESLILVTQVAYLESLKEILNFPVYKSDLEKLDTNPVSEEFRQQVKQLGDLEFDESELENILILKYFHDSKVAQEFNKILLARLLQTSLSDRKAKILTERVSRNTYRYIARTIRTFANEEEEIKSLLQPYEYRDRNELERIQNLKNYLDKIIALLPNEIVFQEKFSYKDIYVPLKAQSVDDNGKLKKNTPNYILQEWVARLLLNEKEKAERVIFIQGAPGRGKSVFCRMFADWIRQNLHPIWTPILIRLRDIVTFENSLEATLRKAVKADFVSSDDGWLSDRNTRYLFILDGFDELRMEKRTASGVEEFLKQVGQFQKDCNNSPDMGHRVIITGRATALLGIDRFLPDNLERIEILPMDDELQKQWFNKWEKVIKNRQEREAFEIFLQDQCCPESVKKELAREPLLLYLLAAMHRDKEFTVTDFVGKNATEAKILIYEKTIDWVLTKQRDRWLTEELTEQEITGLRCILAEAGLAVMQSGGECASISAIEKRLQADNSTKKLLEKAQQRLDDNPLRNAIASFYLRSGSKEGSVEFVHKSFGEFLCAHRLKESLEDWTYPGRNKEFEIDTEEMNWQLYDLLGATNLTPEIVEYLMALLQQSPNFTDVENIVRLFKRLKGFYFRWCEGEFIDVLPPNYPQKKMLLLKEQLHNRFFGQRQVDIYTGLNVLILLFELHRYGQSRDNLKDRVNFHPCGQPNTDKFDRSRLLKIISYSDCLSLSSFNQIVSYFLGRANLRRVNLIDANLSDANLRRVNFINANLSDANLRRANLSDANLIDTNLSDANLSNAYLNGANLSRAYLSGALLGGALLIVANLRKANLIEANLRRANLFEADLGGSDLRKANLSDANLSGANLDSIIWDEHTNWDNVRRLETAKKLPEALRQQLGRID